MKEFIVLIRVLANTWLDRSLSVDPNGDVRLINRIEAVSIDEPQVKERVDKIREFLEKKKYSFNQVEFAHNHVSGIVTRHAEKIT